jgi:hypothetical protein
MRSRPFWAAAAVVLALVPGSVQAQEFNIGPVPMQVHGFFSQGFAKSNENNFLTMDTSDGSGALTDGGANLSAQITAKFRAGAQFYMRNVGDLGNGRFEIDWAYGDYRFAEWIGVRGGKVKTALGLYNDVQDLDFLHTWALLPQSMYPVDLRGSTIGHIGADVYGQVSLGQGGRFNYTAYAGRRPEDPQGGYAYGLQVYNHYDSYAGWQQGGDLRWTTPVRGVLAGASYLQQQIVGTGTNLLAHIPHREESKKDQTFQVYGQFARKGFKLDVEARRYVRDMWLVELNRMIAGDNRGWYVSGAQRLNKYLEVGAYASRFVPHAELDHSLPSNHIYDNVVTARFDLTRYLIVKVEGHFMDGYGAQDSIRGFYAQNNPDGLKPKTNMLVLRTGLNF